MESSKFNETGCSLSFLHGFPHDYQGAYGQKDMDKLEAQLKAPLPHTLSSYTPNHLALLSGTQKSARKMLEKYGWFLVAEANSAHDDGTKVYLMGHGSWKPKGETKVVTKTVVKRVTTAAKNLGVKLRGKKA